MSLQHRGPNICVETFSSVPCPCYMGRRNWGRQSWEVAGCQGCHRHDWWRLTTLLASFTIVSVVVCCLLFVGLCMFIFLFVGFLLTCTHEIGKINRCYSLIHPHDTWKILRGGLVSVLGSFPLRKSLRFESYCWFDIFLGKVFYIISKELHPSKFINLIGESF